MRIKIVVCKVYDVWSWSVIDRHGGGCVSYLDYGKTTSETEAREAAVRAVMFICGQ